jgi:hypothetical protein
MNVAQYKSKYSNSQQSELRVPRRKIDFTMKWVEYSLDVHDMQKLLMTTKNLKDKYTLMDALEIAERKRKWHYRQDGFNLQYASMLLQEMIKNGYTSIE